MSEKHYLVTGASRGIGQAIAERLLRDGATVTVAARSEAAMKELKVRLGEAAERCLVRSADLLEIDDLDGFVAEVEREGGPLDGVVHAAGVQLRKPMVEVTEPELLRILRIHLTVPFLLSTAVARSQIAGERGGSHVFIGSLGSTIAVPNASPYTAAKSGILGVAHSLAVELAPQGIRANVVKPGYIETELTSDLLAVEAQRNRILGRTPMARLGTCDEIAGVVAFLLSDDAAYVTGEDIRVDGGWLAA